MTVVFEVWSLCDAAISWNLLEMKLFSPRPGPQDQDPRRRGLEVCLRRLCRRPQPGQAPCKRSHCVRRSPNPHESVPQRCWAHTRVGANVPNIPGHEAETVKGTGLRDRTHAQFPRGQQRKRPTRGGHRGCQGQGCGWFSLRGWWNTERGSGHTACGARQLRGGRPAGRLSHPSLLTWHMGGCLGLSHPAPTWCLIACGGAVLEEGRKPAL